MSGAVPGTLRVSNDCIADLAGYAALECYGVVGMAEQLQGAESVRLLPGQRLRKGVRRQRPAVPVEVEVIGDGRGAAAGRARRPVH